MSDISIQVENLSKAYQLGKIGTGTISRDIERFVITKILGKEDPFLKIGQINDRTIKGTSDVVWSLRDIDFNISQGEAVGVIGRNGAGKSTLLKILSRVTSPTTGSVKLKGRVASLLEVGTGFHPELSGRENIYLNGAILGMRKSEIKRKFDEIVDFAGVERYIDTPVKRYSSGMYVRLAFAVAAHLESEILIVDEVLAVGDAEFQKKCLGKMGDISKGQGRTILFVSHNMAAIRSLCDKGMYLKDGLLVSQGEVNNIVDEYISGGISQDVSFDYSKVKVGRDTLVSDVRLYSGKEGTENKNKFFMGEPIRIEISVKNKNRLQNIVSSVLVKNSNGVGICAIRTKEMNIQKLTATSDFRLIVSDINNRLMPGSYFITISLGNEGDTFEIIEECLSFEILPFDIYNTAKIPRGNFVTFSEAKWSVDSVS